MVKDILLHVFAGALLFGMLVGLAALSVPWTLAIAVAGGIYIREVTQWQKSHRLPFTRGWLLGGRLQQHLEWAVPAAALLALAAAITL